MPVCTKIDAQLVRDVENIHDYRYRQPLENAPALPELAQKTVDITNDVTCILEFKGGSNELRIGAMRKPTMNVDGNYKVFQAPPEPGATIGRRIRVPSSIDGAEVKYVVDDVNGQPKYFVTENRLGPNQTEYNLISVSHDNLVNEKANIYTLDPGKATVQTRITVETEVRPASASNREATKTTYTVTDRTTGDTKGTVSYMDIKDGPAVIVVQDGDGNKIATKKLGPEVKGDPQTAIGVYRNGLYDTAGTLANYGAEAQNIGATKGSGARVKSPGASRVAPDHLKSTPQVLNDNVSTRLMAQNDPVGKEFFGPDGFLEQDRRVLGASGKDYTRANYENFAASSENLYTSMGQTGFEVSPEGRPMIDKLRADIASGADIPTLAKDVLDLHEVLTKDFSKYAFNKIEGINRVEVPSR